MPEVIQNSILFYSIPLVLAGVLSFIITPYIRKLAVHWKVIDVQNESRKTHPLGKIPLLGGWAVIVSFMITSVIAWTSGLLTDGKINDIHIAAIVISAAIIALGGFLDDRLHLKPLQLIITPIIVSAIAVGVGIQVHFITNPFEAGNGPFGLSLVYFAPWISTIFSFLWILGMMYTVKFLDGLDGLVTGVGAIGAIILFVVSLFWDAPLSGTSMLALILAGALIGFLPYHWYPAKIFLGESSLFVGFMLAVLSIISGGKIATALLIMGIPILDITWVIIRRLIIEKRSPFSGDRTHLHFQLLDSGLSHRQVVLLLYLITFIFGTSSIFLQSKGKVTALGILTGLMIIIIATLIRQYRKKSSNPNPLNPNT